MTTKSNEPNLPAILTDTEANSRSIRWQAFKEDHLLNPFLWGLTALAATAIGVAVTQPELLGTGNSILLVVFTIIFVVVIYSVLFGSSSQLNILEEKYVGYVQKIADNDTAVASWLDAATKDGKSLRLRDYGTAIEHYEWLLKSKGVPFHEDILYGIVPVEDFKSVR